MEELKRQASPSSEPNPLGLSCTLSGVRLAGVPLLRKNKGTFSARPKEEIAELLKSAYDSGVNLRGVMAGLEVAAKAMDSGDLGRAMIRVALLRLPVLDWDRAARMTRTEDKLAQYNQTERRDWHGRWTAGDSSRPAPSTIRTPLKQRLRAAPSRILATSVLASTPARIAAGAELAGGGPADPAADIVAASALAAGFLMSTIAAHRNRPAAASSGNGPRYSPRPQNPDEDECDDLLNKDMISCQIVRAIKGPSKAKTCRSVAMERYSECLKGGPSNVHTPFYWGN